jgi:hypothetical protein
VNKQLRHKPKRQPAQRAVYRIEGYILNPQIPKSMLSPTQRKILKFVKEYHKANEIFPTLSQICKGRIEGEFAADKMRSSRSSVAEILDRLVEYGHLGRCTKSGYTQWLTVEDTEIALANKRSFKAKHG